MSKEQISPRQFAILVFLFSVGDIVALLPTIMANDAKQDGWIVGIFSILVGLLVIWLYDQVSRFYPQYTLVEYSEKILGTWFGKAIALLFIGYCYYYAAVALREIGDFLTSQILLDTPIHAIHIIFTLVVLMAVGLGIETIARSAEVLVIAVVFLFIFLVVFLAPEIDIRNIQPVFEGGIKTILRGSITFVTYPFVELVVLLMIVPYVKQKEKLRKAWFIGVILSGFVLIIVTVLTVLVLGVNLTADQLYPGYKLGKKINIGEFFQRVEISIGAIWFFTIFYRVTLFFYVSITGLAKLFKLNDYRPFLLPLGMILVVLTMVVSTDVIYFGSLNKIWPFLDLACAFIPILLLYIVGTMRKKLSKRKHLSS